MVIKIWSIKNPLLGGVLLASTFSQVARAAELPASQPLPTPGIPTPDQAVRYMATNVVSASRSAAALSSSAKPTVTGVTNSLVSSRPISPLPIASPGLPNPSQVLSSCPANVCGLVATQPPVVLGTALPSGISKNEQSKFENFTNTISTPLKTDAVAPQTITPNDQVTSTVKVSLSIEPGLSKDIAFGQPATKSAKAEKTASKIAEQPTITPTIANITAPDKAIGIGNVQNQITSFTGQLVASSWKLITILPKPQLDASLLNIGSSPFQPYDSLSFSPRLTLGNAAEPLFKTTISSSLNTSPLFATPGSVFKPSPVASQWNQSGFSVKPLSTDGFKLNKFSPYNSFSNLNSFEASTKPFNVMAFLATVNTSTLSSNKFSN